MRWAVIASKTSALGYEVLTPTSSGPEPRSASTSSQLWVSLRRALSDFETKIRAPGVDKPVMAPGLATWTVSVSPEFSTTSARKRLYLLMSVAGISGAGKRIGCIILLSLSTGLHDSD